MKATEMVLSLDPFVVRREVRWGDCDPAGVVYTGRFTDYLLGAVGLYTEHLGEGKRLGEAHEVGTPCRGMSLDFTGTLWPGDVVHIACSLGALRTRSFDIRAHATRPDGSPVFAAVFSPICVRQDARVGTPIPASLREVLLRHGATTHDG
ncbi:MULTISPECIES: acyl-CoA thioesterase [Achromobacter]|jgi:acyl-CoA thioesterase FadM|uniref:Acyl-CoA thioesterase n=1 Tax=Achromobacter aegrifaciens TaxID=1287736 RepID=A0ABU2DJM2_ACHAE|nr:MULTISPECIES: acyl-CoA thioesterase [Achromobacter]PTN52154.1 thioesterase [Achromobacter xylosoxidans]MBD9380174.1 thioesterase family protein [Achromobacter sp. ACM02]MBD9428931.1 thioesterase family protein [Achromobacter sp. ACM03]MBD9473621.1 thioesterase family protein [Achromobacter sp. ACM01]MDQ1760267.1 acyl-CoA thioesterase [Achromobacter aegrifaciens]